MEDRISPRQLAAIAFVSVLSPFIRRFPRDLAARLGRTAWLPVLMAAAVAVLAVALIQLSGRRFPAPVSLGEVFTLAAGRRIGAALIFIYSLWLALYSGATLRFFAERFISTVYQGSAPALFILVMGLACLPPALGRLRSLARCAMIFRLVMAAVPALIIILSLSALDLRLLLPVTAEDALRALPCAGDVLNVLSVCAYLGFLGGRLERGARWRDYALWLGLGLALMLFMCVCCLAMFGAELTGSMSFPVFMLLRDVTVLGSVERIEPMIIAVWVLSDFLLVSVFLHIAGENLASLFAPKAESDAPFRLCVCLAALLALAAALTLGRSRESFAFLSEYLVPRLNSAFALALIPLFILALLRAKKT